MLPMQLLLNHKITWLLNFSWYLWVAFTYEFTSSMKTDFLKDLLFLLNLKTDAPTKLHPHEYAKNHHSRKLAGNVKKS